MSIDTKLTDADRESVIERLDELFLYLGASDFPFKNIHYYPAQLVSLGREEAIGDFRYSPKLSGLKDQWSIQIAWCERNGFVGMRASSVHWSHLARLLAHYRGNIVRMGERAIGHSGNFESYSLLEFLDVDPFGKTRKYYKCTFAYKGAKWYPLSDIPEDSPLFTKQWLLDANAMMVGMAAVEPTYWVAKVSVQPNVPSLALITDPTGIKELWKLRNTAPGKSRRSPLLNWVSDHWRKDRHDPDVELYVRRHLRGQRHLTFKHFTVSLQESQVDTLAALEAKREREAMRSLQPRPDRRQALRTLALKLGVSK